MYDYCLENVQPLLVLCPIIPPIILDWPPLPFSPSETFLKKWIYLAYVWAFLIAYAQVYVGVHYPLDVLGGAVLGILVGSLTAWGFRKKEKGFSVSQGR